MIKKSKAENAIASRIEKAYYAKCCGIQVPIMKIGSIFGHGRALIVSEPQIADEALAQAIHEYVLAIAEIAA